jgi:hypothetical protein
VSAVSAMTGCLLGLLGFCNARSTHAHPRRRRLPLGSGTVPFTPLTFGGFLFTLCTRLPSSRAWPAPLPSGGNATSGPCPLFWIQIVGVVGESQLPSLYEATSCPGGFVSQSSLYKCEPPVRRGDSVACTTCALHSSLTCTPVHVVSLLRPLT